MAPEHYIELRHFTTGARLAIIGGAGGQGDDARNFFRRVTIIKQVNGAGAIQLELPDDHPKLPLADKTLVVDWRRDVDRGIDWYREHVAVFRDEQWLRRSTENTFTALCPGIVSILGWYHVLWPANTTNRTVFTSAKGETIMKTLVTCNATSSATAAAGRDRDARLYGISVEADGAHGNTIDWSANRTHTLLEELQALARVAGGDFDVVYNSSTDRQFRWYTGQRGTDRSATVTFSRKNGNMDNIVFKRVRSTERTAALVGGQGTETNRDVVIRTTGTNYSSTNDIELFVDARDIAKGATAALQARGDQRLDETEARDEFRFDIVQTDSSFYGPSGSGKYGFGDLVTAVRPDGVSVTQQIYIVTLDYTPEAGEEAKIEMRTL